MAKDYFSSNCQNCNGSLTIAALQCDACNLKLEGKIELPRLARLNPEDREFIELFVLAAGSLKEVGKILQISYPTVRARLDKVIENLKQLDNHKKLLRLEIITSLEKGEISSDEALKRLNEL
jgi:hypothetical protein